jgi:hypothetical protein
LPSHPQRRIPARLAQALVALLALGYLVQIATPLRLHADSIVLLSVAETAAHGGGFLYHGQTTVFPPGYPAIVSVLLRLDLPYVWALIGLNAAALFVGLCAVRSILRRRFFDDAGTFRGICILSLLSFVFVKFFAIPLTDICFFGVAMCCLALMESAPEAGLRELAWRLVAAWALVGIAISVRRIGVALIPALIAAMVLRPEFRSLVRRASIRARTAGIIAAGGAAGVILWIVARTSTLSDLGRATAGIGWIDAISQILVYRLRELGEIAINLPFGVTPPAPKALPVLGFFAACVFSAGMWRKARRLGPTEIFVCSYVLVLLFWPYYDQRFWLPIIPLLIAYARVAIEPLMGHRIWRPALSAYLILYAVIGSQVLISSTAVTFSGPNFPSVYHDDVYHATYCVVFGTCREMPATYPVDEAALHVYRVYDSTSSARSFAARAGSTK